MTTLEMSYCKFCIYTQSVNSNFSLRSTVFYCIEIYIRTIVGMILQHTFKRWGSDEIMNKSMTLFLLTEKMS